MEEKSESPSTEEIFDWKDDPLCFLFDVSYFNLEKYVFYIKLVQIFIILYLQTFNVICVIFMINDETLTILRQYFTVFFFQQTGIVTLFFNISYISPMLQLISQLKTYPLPLNITGSKTHKSILNHCARLKIIYTLLRISMFFVYALLLPVIGDEEDIEFPVMYISKYVTVCPLLFLCLYYICISSLGYVLVSICGVCLYVIMHLVFQFTLLLEMLRQISYGFTPNIEDRLYQLSVEQKLKSFVQAHNKVKKITPVFLSFGNWGILMVSLTSSLLFASMVYFMLASISPSSNIRCYFGLIVGFGLALVYARSGQALQDKVWSSELRAVACQCDWEHWNIQNRKTLLLIIINTTKEVKFSSFGIMDVGNDILLRVGKVAYSIIVLFINIRR